jgi:hypothetical protein
MLEFTDPAQISYGDFNHDVPTINWQYRLQQFEIPEVPICAATCRPYYVDPAKKVVWHEVSRQIFGEVHSQIHIHWYFIECVTRLKVFPTKEEFLLFVFNDLIPKKKATLPFPIRRFIDVVFNGYAEIMNKMTPSEFIGKTVRSMRLRSRQAMETGSSSK